MKHLFIDSATSGHIARCAIARFGRDFQTLSRGRIRHRHMGVMVFNFETGAFDQKGR